MKETARERPSVTWSNEEEDEEEDKEDKDTEEGRQVVAWMQSSIYADDEVANPKDGDLEVSNGTAHPSGQGQR